MPPTRKVRYCCEILKERGGATDSLRLVSDGMKALQEILVASMKELGIQKMKQ